MKLIKHILPVCICITLCCPAGYAAEEAADWPQVALTLGAQGGEGEFESFADILVPVYLTEKGLWLVNPRASMTDNDEEEANIGLIYRHLFEERNVIVGGNVYYDSRWTMHDNRFDQLGLGLEVLTEWVDARANLYLPDDDEELVDRFTDQTVQTSVKEYWDEPYATGHEIRQNGTRVTTRTTTTFLFERFEQAREGWDAEIGLKLPGIDDFAEVRVFGGYYSWESQYSGREDIEGFKGRLEARILPILYADVQVFEDKELNGTDWYVGGRINLPFDSQALANGDNPFAGAKEDMKRREQRFADRLFEMVIRDVKIQTEVSDYEEDLEARQVDVDVDKQGIRDTLLEDVRFVDDDADNDPGPNDPLVSDPNENGTAENPYDEIQEGVDNATSPVYVFDGNYNENVVMNDGVDVIGAGEPIYGNGGKVFGGEAGDYPTVNGDQEGPAFTLANNVLLAGFNVVNFDTDAVTGAPNDLFGDTTERYGIYSANVDDFIVRNNRVNGASQGIYMQSDSLVNFSPTVIDNIVENSLLQGIAISHRGIGIPNDSLTAIFAGNQSENNGRNGIGIRYRDVDDVYIGLHGNVASGNNRSGVRIFNAGGANENFTILATGNRATDNQDAGIAIEGPLQLNNDLNVMIYNSDLRNNNLGGGFGGLLIDALVGGDANVAVHNLESTGPGYGARSSITMTGNGDIDARFSGISAPGIAGIALDTVLAALNGDVYTSIQDVDADGINGIGVQSIVNSAGGNAIVHMDSIEAQNVIGIGVFSILAAPGGIAQARLNDIDVDDVTGVGIQSIITGGAGGPASGIYRDISANRFTGNAIISTITGGGAPVMGSFTDIQASDGQGPAIISTVAGGGDDVNALYRNITANNNGAGGYGLLANITGGGGLVRADFENIDASDNGSFGVSSTISGGGDDVIVNYRNINVDRNLAGYGLLANVTGGGGPVSVLMTDIDANNNVGFGIQSILNGGGDDVVGVFRNIEVNDNTTFGLLAILNGPGGQVLGSFRDINANRNLGGFGVDATLTGGGDLVQGDFGNINANGNASHGLNAFLAGGGDDIIGNFLNINVNDNATFGLNANMTGGGGDVLGLFRDISADNNLGGFGVNAVLTGGNTTRGNFVNIDANGNTGHGLSTVLSSAADDVIGYFRNIDVNDNTAFGLQAQITAGGGDNLATFRDIDANGNLGGWGVSATMNGGGGDTITDFFDIDANGNTGYGLSANLSAGAGELNGHFVDINVNNNTAFGMLAQLTAGGGDNMGAFRHINANGNLGGWGVSATLTGGGGDTTAAFMDIDANGNTGYGLNANLAAGAGDLIGDFRDIDANDNTTFGMLATLNGGGGEILGTFHNIAANRNLGGNGFSTVLNGGGNLVRGDYMNITANQNAGLGLSANLNGGGDDVVSTFDNIELNGNTLDGMFLSMVGGGGDVLADLRDIDANNNLLSGINAALNGGGGLVLFNLHDLDASGNTFAGLLVNANNAGGGDSFIDLNDVLADNNGANGLVLIATAGAAPTDDVDIELTQINSFENTLSGLNATLNAGGNVDLLAQDSAFYNNGVFGANIVAGFGGVGNLDFGNGPLGSDGRNSIYGNTGIGLNNAGAGTISAENNFWGGAAPVVGVDYSPAGVNVPATWLLNDPN